MGLSEDGDENGQDIYERFDDLCLDLNLDTSSKDEAWEAFERIRTNYTLEGDGLHWLACALYEACRKSVVPTVGRGTVEGNCVSLTRLLRSSKLSLIQFFSKMKKWADMANLPQEFRDRVDRLESNFAVSSVIFKKFQPIFLDIFNNPADDVPRPPRSRKQRRLPCTPTEVFNFCWTLFVQVKGNFPAISDDLVNSYHLLLCCLDWFYANALCSNRKDLINETFSGLPKEYKNKDFKAPSEAPCVVQLLCEKHEGLILEAKGIKEHWFKPYVKKLFDKKVLKGKMENLTGLLDLQYFESNSKAINHAYEEYVLNVGDFDERIFLGDDASTEIGTPAKSGCTPAIGDNVMQNLQNFDETRALAPSTPLTGRRYLKEKDTSKYITPVSTATQSVSRLQALLSGRKTYPSDMLLDLFKQCSKSPHENVTQRVKQMGEIFCVNYAKPSEDHPGSHIDFAKSRLQLGQSLYYKTLENILLNEKRIYSAKDKQPDFTHLLEQDTFHQSLFACCLEIVIFSYNSQRTFPWIVDTFELPPYYFYKVVEVLIRAEDGLPRDVVKHLNRIEETILESLAWKSESPLWESIKQLNAEIPSCEEVTLPGQIDNQSNLHSHILQSPPQHPALRRIVGDRTNIVKKEGLLSPTGPSAAARFSSPAPGSVKRRLFDIQPSTSGAEGATENDRPMTSVAEVAQPFQSQYLLQPATMEDGTAILVPVQVVTTSNSRAGEAAMASMPSNAATAAASSDSSQSAKPKRTGSLGLFFRKVYHLASVRLKDLCDCLDIDSEAQRQIWTCFEYCLVHHVDMMKDRHLDQIIMCAIYVMAKVTEKDRSFHDIMKCYRMQPQCKPHVYRSVLLNTRSRHASGSSDSSRGGSSRSSTPKQPDTKEDEKQKRESMIRSQSTLPCPQPSSAPPTPTKLAGTGSCFEFEDRGDLIKFYNMVYVKKIKNFALKFSANGPNDRGEAPPLSALPTPRSHPLSPRRISNKHPVYISPHKNRQPTLTPQSRMLYCFNRSPAKDLRAINNMLKLDERKSHMTAQKRLLQGDDGETIGKKLCVDGGSPIVLRRVQEMMREQKANNSQ